MNEKLDRIICSMKEVEILEEQVKKTSELIQKLSNKVLILSVVGQFKQGKSSLINAILGDELLPVGILPLTTAET